MSMNEEHSQECAVQLLLVRDVEQQVKESHRSPHRQMTFDSCYWPWLISELKRVLSRC